MKLSFNMNFPAKILLFGEYGIILNSMALAIPYPRFSGQFRLPGEVTDSKSDEESNCELKTLLAFLKCDTEKFNFINLELFEDEINQGLYLDSSVPVGSGLGLSLIHISEPTRLGMISYAVFCLKKKKKK